MTSTYDPMAHTLEFVIHDLDERAQRMEAALRALASEPGQPHHAAAEALKILNRES